MAKLTKKAQGLLAKYQAGGVFGNVDNFTLNQDNAMMSSSTLDKNPLQTLPTGFEAIMQKNEQIKQQQQQNAVQAMKQTQQNAVPSDKPSGIDNAASVLTKINPGLQVAYGTYNMYQAYKEKKKAKAKSKMYEKDLMQRQNDVRLNEYTNTPYTSYQMSGAMSSFYENQQAANDNIQQTFEEYYNQLNMQNNLKAQSFKQKGIDNIAGGVGSTIGILSKAAGMQEGGTIDPNAEKMDIYSENFDAATFMADGQPVQEDPAQEIRQQERESLMAWVMEDSDETPSDVQEEYLAGFFDQESQPSMNYSSVPSEGVIEAIGQNESRGDYSVVNPTSGTTGKYQFHPRYWSSQIRDFMGMDNSATTDEVMSQFRMNPSAQEGFMNHVVEDIYKPEVEKLRPYSSKYGFTDEQMIKFLHYRGIADTKRRLIKGDFSVSAQEKAKYNNPEILDYLNK